jgi:hypothetical protein
MKRGARPIIILKILYLVVPPGRREKKRSKSRHRHHHHTSPPTTNTRRRAAPRTAYIQQQRAFQRRIGAHSFYRHIFSQALVEHASELTMARGKMNYEASKRLIYDVLCVFSNDSDFNLIFIRRMLQRSYFPAMSRSRVGWAYGTSATSSYLMAMSIWCDLNDVPVPCLLLVKCHLYAYSQDISTNVPT